MVIAIMAAMAAGLAQESYAARFDCTLARTLNGGPYIAAYREIITIPAWTFGQDTVKLHRQFEHDVVEDRGGLMQAQDTPEGLWIMFGVGNGMFHLREAAERDGSYRFDGSYLVMDAGTASVQGTCRSDIRIRPSAAQQATGSRQ